MDRERMFIEDLPETLSGTRPGPATEPPPGSETQTTALSGEEGWEPGDIVSIVAGPPESGDYPDPPHDDGGQPGPVVSIVAGPEEEGNQTDPPHDGGWQPGEIVSVVAGPEEEGNYYSDSEHDSEDLEIGPDWDAENDIVTTTSVGEEGDQTGEQSPTTDIEPTRQPGQDDAQTWQTPTGGFGAGDGPAPDPDVPATEPPPTPAPSAGTDDGGYDDADDETTSASESRAAEEPEDEPADTETVEPV